MDRKDAPKLLFIAERFPPSVGGQQNYNFHLYRQFEKHLDTCLLKPGFYLKFALHNLWFWPWALIAGLVSGRREPITHLHLSSARLAPVGLLLSRLLRARFSTSVHGLDITFAGKSRFYRWRTQRCLRACDHIICNSRATLEQAVGIGLDRDRCHVVPCGVDGARHHRKYPREVARERLEAPLGLALRDRTILVTVGRLIRRKGVAWFTGQVLPQLAEDVVYLVLGQKGPELEKIEKTIAAQDLSRKVRILADAPDSLRDVVYDAADLFVMPNIQVHGHREGFGIVLLEAGMRGIPVVASRLEGIPDAVIEGVTGLLVRAADPQAFVEGIRQVLAWKVDADGLSRAIATRYSWEKAYQSFAEILQLPQPQEERP